jgi:hypothetical protein
VVGVGEKVIIRLTRRSEADMKRFCVPKRKQICKNKEAKFVNHNTIINEQYPNTNHPSFFHPDGSWSSIFPEGKVLTYSCQLPY